MLPAAPRVSLGDYTLRVLVTALVVILLLAAWELRAVLLLVFLAGIFAIVIQVPVRRLQSMGVSRGLSILITMLGLLLVLVLLVVLIVPAFVEQIGNLGAALPDAFEEARSEYDRLAEENTWLPKIDWQQVTEGDARDFVVDQAGQVTRNIFPFLSGIGGVIANILFIMLIAIFFVTDPGDYLEGMLILVPGSYRPRALLILEQLGQIIQRWFIGQLISMTMLGSLITFITGVVLGLPNPLALGMIAGLMEFIPNIGSIISVIPAILVALAEDPALAPWTILAYIATQQIQSNLIMPRIMSRQIALPAATVLIAQVIAAALFGFMGLLLALPLAIVVMVLVRELYVFDVLNTRSAQIETHARPDGSKFHVVTSERYRPEQLSPGEAARLLARGENPFEFGDNQVIEIVTPPSPVLEQAARGQQAVWIALLALVAAQALALVRTLLSRQGE